MREQPVGNPYAQIPGCENLARTPRRHQENPHLAIIVVLFLLILVFLGRRLLTNIIVIFFFIVTPLIAALVAALIPTLLIILPGQNWKMTAIALLGPRDCICSISCSR